MKNKKISPYTLDNIKCYGLIILAFIILYPMQQARMINNSISGQLVPICCYIVMAISLNLTVGVLGELSLGHAGFMSIGAFSGVIVGATLQNAALPTWSVILISIVIGGLIAGFAGFVIGIPVLRLRGDYLAIVTLAFGEIIKNIINCLYVGIDPNGLHMNMTSVADLNLQAGRVIINGPQGATGITKNATFFIGVLLILFTLFVVLNFIYSKNGRAVMALRDNRIAATAMGINVTKYKLTAFIISAMLAGMAGALYAMNFSTIAAKKFDFNTSILVLVFVVLGGMGNIFATIIATAVLYMLPELLRSMSDYRMLIYAIVLILVMLLRNSSRSKQFFIWFKTKILNKKIDEGGNQNV